MKISLTATNESGELKYEIRQNNKLMITFNEHQAKEALNTYSNYLKDWKMDKPQKQNKTLN